MKKSLKQYNQEDLNQIVSVDPVAEVVKDTEKLELPQIEVEETPEFTHDQLHDALMFTEDVLQRSMIPFVLLGETAQAIRSTDLPMLEGLLVHIGVMKRYASPEGISTLKSLLPKEAFMDHKMISFQHNEVPVQIDIIFNDYDFFQYPDVKGYYQSQLSLPNPFDEYWKWKGEIR